MKGKADVSLNTMQRSMMRLLSILMDSQMSLIVIFSPTR
nr:MAG TPA: hypothetical protein [Caudoviricetes sp.]